MLAIDLHGGDGLRVDIAAQPDAVTGKSAIAFALGDIRLLQQRQPGRRRPLR